METIQLMQHIIKDTISSMTLSDVVFATLTETGAQLGSSLEIPMSSIIVGETVSSVVEASGKPLAAEQRVALLRMAGGQRYVLLTRFME